MISMSHVWLNIPQSLFSGFDKLLISVNHHLLQNRGQLQVLIVRLLMSTIGTWLSLFLKLLFTPDIDDTVFSWCFP